MALRTCRHCGCNTNARLRRCCDAGYADDTRRAEHWYAFVATERAEHFARGGRILPDVRR